MGKQTTDFRYNTGATRVPWAAVGENYNVSDLMEIIKFLMQGEGAEYDAAISAVWEQVKKLEGGIDIDGDGRLTEPCDVFVIERKEDRTVLNFIIHEGRNRQIRRMCEAVNLEVARLRRIAVGSVKLGMLQTGEWRDLTPAEVEGLFKAAGVKMNGGAK